MATLLIGYDTESAAVGEGLARFIGPDVPQYRAALDPDSTRRGVGLLARLHEELEAPCTFFLCGRTLLHALDAIEPLAGSPLFDLQQHTYSHVVFRDVRYRAEGAEAEAVLPETPPVALREELRMTSELIRKYLGRECIGAADAVRLLPRAPRPPRPARDRPRHRTPLRHLVGPERGERQPDAVGAAVRLRGGGLPGRARDPLPVLARRDLVRHLRLRPGRRASAARSRAPSTRSPIRTSSSRPPSTSGARSRRTRRAPAGSEASSSTRGSAAWRS